MESAGHPLNGRLERALARLRLERLKVTPARVAILRTLTTRHGPFTMEELHQAIGPNECDLVTVYRSLASLEKIDLIQRCEFGDGVSRYEFNDPTRHHHHVVCRQCQRVDEVKLCPLDFLDQEVAKLGYASVGHLVSFSGICRDCQAE